MKENNIEKVVLYKCKSNKKMCEKHKKNRNEASIKMVQNNARVNTGEYQRKRREQRKQIKYAEKETTSVKYFATI